MVQTPVTLSYAQPAAADPRLRGWGLAAMAVGMVSILLTLTALALGVMRVLAARGLTSPEAEPWSMLLHRDVTRLVQPNLPLAIALGTLLFLALVLALRLLGAAIALLRQRPCLGDLRAWARWRIALSLMIPIPALLLGNNIQAVYAQHAFSTDARLMVGGLLTGLAWVELILPLTILWRIRP